MKYFRSAADWQNHFARLLKEKHLAYPNPECSCPKCKSHFAAARAARLNPPDPYKPHLAGLRATAARHSKADHDHLGAGWDTESNMDANGVHLAAASAANRLLGPSVVKSTPDPYAPHLTDRALAANDLEPSMDPDYQTDGRGRPANGYKIALAMRKANE